MYEFDGRIRFSEADCNGELTIMGMLNYFQDCSTFQSEDMNVGIDYYKSLRQAWVINYWQIDFIKQPRLGDRVTIGTLPYALKSFLGYRNFYMKDSLTGEMYAKANSIWTLIDIDTNKPARANDRIVEAYKIEEKLDMDYCDRKKVMVSDDAVEMEPIIVSKHHLDTNNHVNNGQYVKLALDFVPEDFVIKRLQAEYVNQARLGDTIIPKVSLTENAVSVSLNNTDGKAYCRIMFS